MSTAFRSFQKTVTHVNCAAASVDGIEKLVAMVTSIFATCSDNCGWVGAVVAALSFGSFGVPLKTSVKVEVDPLIMQVSVCGSLVCSSCVFGVGFTQWSSTSFSLVL